MIRENNTSDIKTINNNKSPIVRLYLDYIEIKIYSIFKNTNVYLKKKEFKK